MPPREPVLPQPLPGEVQNFLDAKLPADPSSHRRKNSSDDGGCWDDDTVVGDDESVTEVEKETPLGIGDENKVVRGQMIDILGAGVSTAANTAGSVKSYVPKAAEMTPPASSATPTTESAVATTGGGTNGMIDEPQENSNIPGKHSSKEVSSLLHREQESKRGHPTVSPRKGPESGAVVTSSSLAAQDKVLIGGLKLPAGAVIKKKKKRKS